MGTVKYSIYSSATVDVCSGRVTVPGPGPGRARVGYIQRSHGPVRPGSPHDLLLDHHTLTQYFKDPPAKAAPLRNEKGVKIHWFPVFSVYIDSVCITEL